MEGKWASYNTDNKKSLHHLTVTNWTSVISFSILFLKTWQVKIELGIIIRYYSFELCVLGWAWSSAWWPALRRRLDGWRRSCQSQPWWLPFWWPHRTLAASRLHQHRWCVVPPPRDNDTLVTKIKGQENFSGALQTICKKHGQLLYNGILSENLSISKPILYLFWYSYNNLPWLLSL